MSGTRKSGTKSRKKAPTAPRQKAGSDRRLYGGLAALAVALGAIVWWSLPGDHPSRAATEDDAGLEEADAAAPKSTDGIDRPPRANAELAILADKPDDEIRRIATVSEITRRLEPRHCGSACDAVKKFMSDEDGFELDVMKTDDVILPPQDAMDTVAPGLTARERESVRARPTSVMVRTNGAPTPAQLPARAAYAATAVLAEALAGYVYDEAARRIETAAEFGGHVIVAPLGAPVFTPRQIAVQFYRQEDGTARLLTLGMARYGSPDLSLRGANMGSGPLLAEVLNVAARQLAHGWTDRTVTVTLAEVATMVGRKPVDLNPEPDHAKPVVLDVVEPERLEGDPDNDLAELVPSGGSSRESWEEVIASLFGVPPSVAVAPNDKELGEITKRARRDLPSAIKRFEAGEGELFVKGRFPIPEESRADGGPTTEFLWIAAAACDPQLCTGTLSNEPTYATNLAAGKTTSVARADAVDWMIRQRDGGTVGGESIRVLTRRGAR